MKCVYVYSGIACAVCLTHGEPTCPTWLTLTPRLGYLRSEKTYYAVCQELTSVPTNIPADAKEVVIEGNLISTLKANDFSHLDQCIELSLYASEVRVIEVGAFRGLVVLEILDLHENSIKHISAGTFSGLPALRKLSLWHNPLTALSWTIFGGLDKAGNMIHPTSLNLVLGNTDNKFHCDSSLCWLTQGEEEGWLSLSFGGPGCSNHPHPLMYNNHYTWKEIDFNCSTWGKSFHLHSGQALHGGLHVLGSQENGKKNSQGAGC